MYRCFHFTIWTNFKALMTNITFCSLSCSFTVRLTSHFSQQKWYFCLVPCGKQTDHGFEPRWKINIFLSGLIFPGSSPDLLCHMAVTIRISTEKGLVQRYRGRMSSYDGSVCLGQLQLREIQVALTLKFNPLKYFYLLTVSENTETAI